MQRVGSRKYRVAAEDFPIEVVVAAKRLPACRAVVSIVDMLVDGSADESIEVTTVDDAENLSLSYSISRPPRRSGSVELIQTIHATFGSMAPDTSEYQISITSAAGDSELTRLTRPTIDPGKALLRFQVK
jgi:hypothetical protein